MANINFENLTFDAQGMVGDTEVPFLLPRRLQRRTLLKLKYFGYHSGLSADHEDAGGNTFSATNLEDQKRKEYQWRGMVKEVNMKVLADGVNIMHENVSSHYRDDVDKASFNSVENREFLSFPISKDIQAPYVSGGVIQENNVIRPLPVARGHSQFYDIGIGHVEENVSEIKIVLSALSISLEGISPLTHSQEPNVRMDTISILLELNE